MLKQNNFIKKTASKRLGKIILTLLATVFMFGGPTYMLYALRKAIAFPYLEILSIVVFVIGLFIFLQIYEEEKH